MVFLNGPRNYPPDPEVCQGNAIPPSEPVQDLLQDGIGHHRQKALRGPSKPHVPCALREWLNHLDHMAVDGKMDKGCGVQGHGPDSTEDHEIGEPLRVNIINDHRTDLREGRTFAAPRDEGVHIGQRPFRLDQYPAVRKILNMSQNVQPLGGFLCSLPEPYALYSP